MRSDHIETFCLVIKHQGFFEDEFPFVALASCQGAMSVSFGECRRLMLFAAAWNKSAVSAHDKYN